VSGTPAFPGSPGGPAQLRRSDQRQQATASPPRNSNELLPAAEALQLADTQRGSPCSQAQGCGVGAHRFARGTHKQQINGLESATCRRLRAAKWRALPLPPQQLADQAARW